MAIKMNKPASTAKPASVYDKHLGSTEVTATTSTYKKVGKDDEKLVSTKQEVVHPGVLMPESQLYKLTISGGRTLNLGNYESARLDCGITIPSTKEDLEASYQWGMAWIGEKIEAAVAEAKG